MRNPIILRLITITLAILFTGCASRHELYSYKGTPCENKTFTTTTEVLLLQKDSSYSYLLQYDVSKYYLQEYQDYQDYLDEHRITFQEPITKKYKTPHMYTKEIKLYPVGSQFQIQKVYGYFSGSIEGSHWSHYYLVRSLEDNQTMWLNIENISPKTCTMQTGINPLNHSDDFKQADYLRKTYEYTAIDAKWFPVDDFSKDEDLFAVSRQYQKTHVTANVEKIKPKETKTLYSHINNNTFNYFYYEWLKENHTDVNIRYQENQTPLILATQQHNADAVNYLLKLGADTSLKDNYGKQAIDYADKADDGHIYTSLKMYEALQNDHKQNGDTASTLVVYDKKSDTATVQTIHVDNKTWSPLIVAIKEHHNDKALQMIQDKQYLSDTTNNGSTPIYSAVIYKNNAMLDALLAINVDINLTNSYGLTPLYAAVIENNSYAVQKLLDHGADMYTLFKREQTNAFVRAIIDDDLNITTLFLEKPIDIDKADEEGTGLQYVAQRCNHPEMFELLLKYGANKNREKPYKKRTQEILQRSCKNPKQLERFNALLQ